MGRRILALPFLASVWLTLLAICLPASAAAYSVGGSVNGLVGSVITLQLNGAETVTVSDNGSFQFATALATSQTYKVIVATLPANQRCTLTRASGTIASKNIINVSVVCDPPQYRVGGTVEGLTGTVKLKLNGVKTVSVTASGGFDFGTTTLPAQQAYSVVIVSKPARQQCTIANASGTMGNDHISDIRVSCTDILFAVGGTVSGLVGSITLQLNNEATQTLTNSGSFQFPSALAQGEAYSLTIATQPVGQRCLITYGSGKMPTADVTNIRISCSQINYRVGGTVEGLAGTLKLTLNGTELLTRITNGSFQFATRLTHQQAYDVVVTTKPANQQCVISNGSGAINAANVTNITVSCVSATPQYRVGGSISGLVGSATLQLNQAEALTLSANGSFQFTTNLASLQAYSVALTAKPDRQQCTLANASGTIGTANISNVNIVCSDVLYSVGGAVSGLNGQLQLQLNNAASLTVSGDGGYQFPASLALGDAYSVAITSQPVGQQCSISGASGSMPAANIGNIKISCTQVPYRIGGSISGLDGTAQIQLNGSETLSLTTNGSFQFATTLTHSQTYSVALVTQPVGQQCTLSNGSGAINAADIGTIAISCQSLQYQVGGNVSGLVGQLQLQLNGAAPLSISSNGNFQFPTTLMHGSAYSVALSSQPAGQQCAIANQSGSINAANVGNISVSCTNIFYSAGGTATGFTGEITLQLNGTATLTLNGAGSFEFPASLVKGDAYGIVVLAEPAGHWCEVSNGGGTIGAGNVGNISIGCHALAYSVGGTVSGFNSYGWLGLQLNNQGPVGINQSGTFLLGGLAHGENFNVAIVEQPFGQHCEIAGESGVVNAANVESVVVTCEPLHYNVGVVVSGLWMGNFTIQLNNAETLQIAEDGSYQFDMPVQHGEPLVANVIAQPVDQLCEVWSPGFGVAYSDSVLEVNCHPTSPANPPVISHIWPDFLVAGKEVKISGNHLGLAKIRLDGVTIEPAVRTAHELRFIAPYTRYFYTLELLNPYGLTRRSLDKGTVMTGVKAMTGGEGHSCALMQTGKVQCWGSSNSDLIGTGSIDKLAHPAEVVGLSNVTQISGGDAHNCALLSDHTIRCWGSGDYGQLGGTSYQSGTRLTQVAGINMADEVSTGTSFSCARLMTGKINCWGSNQNGQLGNGSTTNSSTPVQVSNLGYVTAISSSANHSCAVGAATAPVAPFVYCWGLNTKARYTASTIEYSTVPVEIPGPISAKALSTSTYYSCALLYSGQVKCWGTNYGSTPVLIDGVSNAVSLVSGLYHTCALLSDKTVRCWGQGDRGATGSGSMAASNSTPAQVAGLNNVVAIGAGNYHTCATLESGEVKCWGFNDRNQLGNGSVFQARTPVTIKNISNVQSLSVGDGHVCARGLDNSVRCWGLNSLGQLGNGTKLQDQATTSVLGNAIAIGAGSDNSCALVADGHLECWGHDIIDWSGVFSDTTPRPVADIAGAISVDMGDRFGCAVLATKAVTCWGSNPFTQSGFGPAPVSGINNAVAVSTGKNHSCVVVEGGGLKCWGDNSSGQLGLGYTSAQVPVPFAVGISNVTAVSAGNTHTCALVQGGDVYCWGANASGALGNGTVNSSSVPLKVVGLAGATKVSAGLNFSCALLQNGKVSCWGANSLGELGNGSSDLQSLPVEVVGISDAVSIDASGQDACAVLRNGQVQCWGANHYGQLTLPYGVTPGMSAFYNY